MINLETWGPPWPEDHFNEETGITDKPRTVLSNQYYVRPWPRFSFGRKSFEESLIDWANNVDMLDSRFDYYVGIFYEIVQQSYHIVYLRLLVPEIPNPKNKE